MGTFTLSTVANGADEAKAKYLAGDTQVFYTNGGATLLGGDSLFTDSGLTTLATPNGYYGASDGFYYASYGVIVSHRAEYDTYRVVTPILTPAPTPAYTAGPPPVTAAYTPPPTPPPATAVTTPAPTPGPTPPPPTPPPTPPPATPGPTPPPPTYTRLVECGGNPASPTHYVIGSISYGDTFYSEYSICYFAVGTTTSPTGTELFIGTVNGCSCPTPPPATPPPTPPTVTVSFTTGCSGGQTFVNLSATTAYQTTAPSYVWLVTTNGGTDFSNSANYISPQNNSGLADGSYYVAAYDTANGDYDVSCCTANQNCAGAGTPPPTPAPVIYTYVSLCGSGGAISGYITGNYANGTNLEDTTTNDCYIAVGTTTSPTGTLMPNSFTANTCTCPTPAPTPPPPTPAPGANSFTLNSSAQGTGFDACAQYNSISLLTYYSLSGAIGSGTSLYTDPGLSSYVSDGYYSNGSVYWYFAGGSTADSGFSCSTPPPPTPPPPTPPPPTPAPSVNSFLLNSSPQGTGYDSCVQYNSFSRATYYSLSGAIGSGTSLYTDSGLSTFVSDGYYSNGSVYWYFAGGSTADSGFSC